MSEAAVSPRWQQERLAAIVHDTVNPPKTKKEAALRAGYSLATASKTPGRALASAGFEVASRAILERQRGNRDKARDGLAACVKRLADAVGDANLMEIAAIAQTLTKILDSDAIDTTESFTPADHTATWESTRRGLAMAYRMGMRAGLARRKPVLKAHTGRFRLWHNVTGYVELPVIIDESENELSLQNGSYRTQESESAESASIPPDTGTIAP